MVVSVPGPKETLKIFRRVSERVNRLFLACWQVTYSHISLFYYKKKQTAIIMILHMNKIREITGVENSRQSKAPSFYIAVSPHRAKFPFLIHLIGTLS